MEAGRVNPRMIVQCDWDCVLSEDGGKVWTTYRNDDAGLPRVHGNIKCHGISTNGSPYLSSSDGFHVDHITKKQLTLSYTSEGCSLKRTFQAPDITFASVHQTNRKIVSLDVTPGGLAVSTDGTNVNVWTSNNGEVRRQLSGHVGDVTTCQFFPSGLVILTGSEDLRLKIWSAETGQCAATLVGHRAGVTGSVVVDRGRNVVSTSRDGSARLWDCGSQTCITTYDDLGGIVNGCSLDVVGAEIDLQRPDQQPSEKEVGTGGKMLLLAMESGHLHGYGLQSHKQIFSYDCGNAVNCCSHISENLVVCGTDDSSIYLLDLRNTSIPVAHLKESRSAILSMLPYKRGIFATTGDGSCFYVNEGYDTTLELTGPDCDPVYGAVVDHSHLYSSARDGLIRKYRLNLPP